MGLIHDPSTTPPPGDAVGVNGERSDPLLQVDGLRKDYGAITALDGVSFEIHTGDVVGLLGDNGAGKSTLVNILSGAVIPTAGRIVFDGAERTFSNPADARSIGIETVYQQLALVEMFDIATNFYLGRERKRSGILGALGFLDRPGMRREASQAVQRLPTSFPDLGASIETMSGGQRQAVAIARAAFWGGRLLLLDEPTAALGVKEAAGVLQMIGHLVAESNMAMIVISHNIEHVWSVCTRMLVLRQGRLVSDVRREATTKAGIVADITGASA
jgi:ABC-type sugar transport system ATPase subunit